MFRPSDGRPPLSPSDVLRNPTNWQEISRNEAVAAAGTGQVVVVNGSAGRSDWFDSNHPLYRASPQALRGVRYYRFQDRSPVAHGRLGHGSTTATPEPPPPVAPPPPVKPKTWIEIELLTEAGVPVPNERYAIKIPDGTTQSGRTDRRGQARVDGIDPGACEISFPDIDGRAWREG
jgi:hypothetical protein